MRAKKLLFMLLAVCFIWFFQPGTVSAADGEILVNGTNILTAHDQQVACGTGTAKYDSNTRTLTLNQAVIDNTLLSGGIEIWVEGVTVELIGQNAITSKNGIISNYPVTIRGIGGGKLVVRTVDSSYGLHVIGGGLTVRDADLQFFIKNTSVLDAAIDIRGGDNLISNSRIEITMEMSQNMEGVGIDATGASSLTISDHSSIVMHEVDQGIAGGADLTISGSSLTIEEAGGTADAMRMEIFL